MFNHFQKNTFGYSFVYFIGNLHHQFFFFCAHFSVFILRFFSSFFDNSCHSMAKVQNIFENILPLNKNGGFIATD